MRLRALLVKNVFARKLRTAEPALREAATAAAAEALHNELRRNTAVASLSITARGTRRSVGSLDARDAEQEFGTSTQTPSPWLAPVLPLALEPMRAAANTHVREAAARAVSVLGKRKQ